MIKQIFLSRALNQEQSILIGSEETASTAQTYETAWQKLAMAIFQSSQHDPAFAAVLKESGVEIRTKPKEGSLLPSPGDSNSSSPVPAKAPVGP
jgi:hypothetical protein